MRTKLLAFILSLQFVYGQVVEFETDGIAPSQNSLSPATVATGLSVQDLTRGAGLSIAGTAANTFSAGNFTSLTSIEAFQNEHFFEFEITVDQGYIFTPATISVNIRRSSTGPRFFKWYYSTNCDPTWHPVSDEVLYDRTPSNGESLGPFVFPEVAELTNMLPGDILQLRLYGWGASSANGIAAIGRLSGSDLTLNGSLISYGNQALIIDEISPVPVCLNSSNPGNVQVSIQSFGSFTNEAFQIELSDETGQFTTTQSLFSGTITGLNSNLSIPLVFPGTLQTGTNYKLRIQAGTGITTSISHPITIINGTENVTVLGCIF